MIKISKGQHTSRRAGEATLDKMKGEILGMPEAAIVPLPDGRAIFVETAETAALEKLRDLLGPYYVEGALMPPPGISAKHYLMALAETVATTEISEQAWTLAYLAFARTLRQAGELPMPFGEP